MSLEIKLKRVDRVYYPGDIVKGTVEIHSKGSLVHQGISLLVEGSVVLQMSAKSVGLFEAFYSTMKPVVLLQYQFEVDPGRKVPDGITECPFEFKLEAVDGLKLYETYHGVYVNVQYLITADMIRPLLAKDVKKTCEFIVETPPRDVAVDTKPVEFTITPESLENVRQSSLSHIPRFRLTGRLDAAACSVVKPFTGTLVVEESAALIKSIEVQLVRVETCGSSEGLAKEATEIQSIQVADGDVCRNVEIPIYMIFPRLFTCPSVAVRNFQIDFEANLVVQFADGYMVTENFPIRLYR